MTRKKSVRREVYDISLFSVWCFCSFDDECTCTCDAFRRCSFLKEKKKKKKQKKQIKAANERLCLSSVLRCFD